MSGILARGRELFRHLRLPTGWEAELYFQRARFREVAWAERRAEDVVSGWSEGMALRALSQGRQGFAFANEISEPVVERLWEQARAAAAVLPVDEHRTLLDPAPADGKEKNGGVDGAIFRKSVKEHQARLSGWEKKLLATDRRLKKALNLSLREQLDESVVLNSRGVEVAEASSAVAFSVELMGESKKEVQVAWDYAETRFWKDLDVSRVLARLADQVLFSFGAGPLSSGAWPVVFAPRVGVEFLELLSDALCADAVQRGKSLFAGRLGEDVGSKLVTLIDDGRYPGGLASGLYDEEGCPTQTVALLERGRLRDFMYDSYTAHKEGRPSSGNGSRPGIAGPPSPDSSNFFLKPGKTKAAALLKESGRAFVVHDVMGMHTADPVSGDFSVGATGALLEKGRITRPVKGVTLAGNLLDLLKKIDGVADDLTWYGSTGAPTFRVSGLSIGGN